MEKQNKQFSQRAIATAIAMVACGAMNANAQKSALEEVIVTAQKKDETLQNVPMTVNAVTADMVDKYNMLDFKDIAQVTPGLTIESNSPRNANVSLRGIQVNTDAAAGVAVSIYWNEVGYDIDSAFKAMYDIGRLEVLRGPQGTLRGVTAPAGAITIRTAAPNYDQTEGYLQQSFSDQSLSNSQFAISMPLIDDILALRIAGLYDHNEGSGTTNVVTGMHESAETRSGRVTLGFRPTETVEATLLYQHMEDIADSIPLLVGNGLSGNFGRYDRRGATDLDGLAHARRDIATLNVTWDLQDHELIYIGGYQRRRIYNLADMDNGNGLSKPYWITDTAVPQEVRSRLEDWSHELRFSSVDADFYNYTYGLYYSRQSSSTPVTQARLIGLYNFDDDIYFDPLLGNVNFNIDSSSEGYAAFTNQSFQVTDDTEVQFGLRYQKQKTSVNSLLSVAIGSIPPIVSSQVFNANDEAVTGSASISHQLTDDVRIYANYGRSFRPSGSSPVPASPMLRAGTWDPETSDSIELGFKSRWNDARLQLNGDVFYQRFHDFIARAAGIWTNNNLEGTKNFTYGFNYSADVVIQGAEMSLDTLLTDNWQAGTSISYTDARYDNANQPCNRFVNGVPQIPTDAEYFTCKSNGRLGTEPNWMVSVTSEYVWPMGGFEPFVRALYNYRSFRADDTLQDGKTPGYGVINLFVGIRSTTEAWEVSLWAKNLTDHKAYTSAGDPILLTADDSSSGRTPINTGYSPYQIIPEREVGITGRYRF